MKTHVPLQGDNPPKPLVKSRSFWGQVATSVGLALQLAKPVIPIQYHPIADAIATILLGGTLVGIKGIKNRTQPIQGLLS